MTAGYRRVRRLGAQWCSRSKSSRSNGGWPNQSHQDVRAVASQIALEFGFDHDQSEILTDAYRVGHQNFYENYHRAETLADLIDRVEGLLPYLIELTVTLPRPFTITSNTQLRRLRRLTGDDSLEMGDTSPVGFSKNQ